MFRDRMKILEIKRAFFYEVDYLLVKILHFHFYSDFPKSSSQRKHSRKSLYFVIHPKV